MPIENISCQLQKVRMVPWGRKEPWVWFQALLTRTTYLERPGDKGLMVASWWINRTKVPFGRLILKKEETHSLKVNEKWHKVKMKFIMFLTFLIFFSIFVFLNKTVCKTAILSPRQSDPWKMHISLLKALTRFFFVLFSFFKTHIFKNYTIYKTKQYNIKIHVAWGHTSNKPPFPL